MNNDASTIQFRTSTTAFIVQWRAAEVLYRIGRTVALCTVGLSAVIFLLHVLLMVSNAQIPIISLYDGSATSRLVWLTILLDIPALYVMSEIMRRKGYTSKDDVYGFLDPITRALMVEILRAAKSAGSALTPEVALRLILQSSYLGYLLSRLEINPETVRVVLDGVPLSETSTGQAGELDANMKQYLIESAQRALRRGDQSFGVADIFLTLLQHDSSFQQQFAKLDLTPERWQVVLTSLSSEDHLRKSYTDIHSKHMHTGSKNRAWTSVPTPILDHYGQDMTVAAAYGAAPYITVHQKEVDQAMRALSGATKNSLLIVGEPGVGKSSIIERIALKMLSDDVPRDMQDKRLVKLDIAALHGSQGGFAAGFEAVIAQAEQAGNVILFIPELQDLATEQTEGMSSAELLLPILERGRMQVIGATSMKEYHQHIEKSSSLASAFTIIELVEMSEQDAVTVLEEAALVLESKHKVSITLKAIEAAVSLSARYIHDRVLPEKAIRLLDEACGLAAANDKVVSENTIRQVISDATNVPLTQMGDSEQQLLLHLEDDLHGKVIGQDEAVHAVAEAMRRARTGLSDVDRPLGVFLFVGPTGVGKTELAKALASVYFKNVEALVRLDMSEFHESDAVEKLIGSPGHEGLLTSPVRTHPFALLLLDEFEKASDEARNLFLQVFDDARVTDAEGHVVDFKNTIIIATSNAGSIEIQQAVQANTAYANLQQLLTSQILPTLFRPELLNRFDGVIVFKTLTESQISQIARLELTEVAERLKATSGVEVQFTDACIARVGQLGFDPQYGGRPLRRVIQDKVEGPLSQMLLSKQLTRGQAFQFDVESIGV